MSKLKGKKFVYVGTSRPEWVDEQVEVIRATLQSVTVKFSDDSEAKVALAAFKRDFEEDLAEEEDNQEEQEQEEEGQEEEQEEEEDKQEDKQEEEVKSSKKVTKKEPKPKKESKSKKEPKPKKDYSKIREELIKYCEKQKFSLTENQQYVGIKDEQNYGAIVLTKFGAIRVKNIALEGSSYEADKWITGTYDAQFSMDRDIKELIEIIELGIKFSNKCVVKTVSNKDKTK